MIRRESLLADLQKLIGRLEDDLRERCDTRAELDAPLRAEWDQARRSNRTDYPYETWREDRFTQIAGAWILSATFVRFCEDNALIDVRLAGPGDRLRLARERRTAHFAAHPADNDRDYLLSVFEEMALLAPTSRLYDRTNPLWELAPSADACGDLLANFTRLDDGGALAHDFTDLRLGTRFLGDLYQDLSEHARDTYALFQTPEFVEEFILDRTLDHAIDDFGLDHATLLDPACGSGHFLLGAFDRLFSRRRQRNPAANPIEHAIAVFQTLAGVDLNPYAVAIARFRLLVAALRACGIRRLADAPDFDVAVAAGDSLLHGPRANQLLDDADYAAEAYRHLYATEDRPLLQRILGRRYTVVVGNPPYTTPTDPAANVAYRSRYGSCHREYLLATPFFERFFDLAVAADRPDDPAGYIGTITANSFLKRESGSKLVEQYLPRWDVEMMIDTSGSYIPGHGTPTLIVIGRNRNPVSDTVRAIMGIRGEPTVPDEPAQGKVWTAIVNQVDRPGSESPYVVSLDWPRSRLHQHPVVFGGGADLWFQITAQQKEVLARRVRLIGYTGQTNVDPVMIAPSRAFERRGVEANVHRRLVVGKELRDWTLLPGEHVLFPYDEKSLRVIEELPGLLHWVWPARTVMGSRRTFGKKSYFEEGRPWWAWHQLALQRMQPALSIGFAFVETHNHFVLDCDASVFNRTGPMIKLPTDATVEDHLELLGPLNSSFGCFWMKQVSHSKGNEGYQSGIKSENWERFYEFTGTQLQQFPLPSASALPWTARLGDLAKESSKCRPTAVAEASVPTRGALDAARHRADVIRAEMLAVQEELDWRCLFLYGVCSEDLSLPPDAVPPIRKGERAFEVVLARQLKAGESDTTWFERHGSTPITDLPSHWPDGYRRVVVRRVELIESDRNIAQVERPENKRRWNWEGWEKLEEEALRGWLLDRLEDPSIWASPQTTTIARLTQAARALDGFDEVARLYGGMDVSPTDLVRKLVEGDGVPYLAAWRYKSSGLRKHRQWDAVWELQRAEDEIDARTGLDPAHPLYLPSDVAAEEKAKQVGRIPKPPAYTATDFRSSIISALRGELDVPKERFITYPGAAAPDGDTSAVVGWAGWDHAEQARAAAGLYVARQRQQCGDEVLVALLAGVWELVPWVVQWHNEPDSTGRRAGDQLRSFVEAEVRRLGRTTDDLVAWTPPEPTRGRRRRSG